ncbi:MAG: hypothetical protein A2V85_13440 [Chloroflexi bacterium RBG_16_72_14]|nr:MAG: hypothetical protein A2V85_13440 [Chloroflexi bacterium RBG_16_72_14]
MPVVTAPLPPLLLFGRRACHLCDEARTMLDALLADRAAHGLPVPLVEERDIDTDETLHRRYALTIPVIAIDGRELELVTSAAKLRRFLAEALDGAAGAVS